MKNEKFEKAAELISGIIQDSYGNIESLAEIKAALNQMEDNVLIPRETASALLEMVNIEIKNNEDDPRMGGRSTEGSYNLKKALEDAIGQ